MKLYYIIFNRRIILHSVTLHHTILCYIIKDGKQVAGPPPQAYLEYARQNVRKAMKLLTLCQFNLAESRALGDGQDGRDKERPTMRDSARYVQKSAKPRRATKEGQWVPRTPLHIRTFFFSAQHGSKNPGFVLRPHSPYAIASLGVA